MYFDVAGVPVTRPVAWSRPRGDVYAMMDELDRRMRWLRLGPLPVEVDDE